LGVRVRRSDLSEVRHFRLLPAGVSRDEVRDDQAARYRRGGSGQGGHRECE
jgi:hypothetical protein